MQITNYKPRIIGIIGLLISAILIICFSDLVLFMTNFGEKYLSPGNYLEPKTVYKIEILTVFFILLTIALSVLYIFNLMRKIPLFLNTYFQTNKVITLFLTDELCKIKRLSLYILVIGTTLGSLLLLYSLLVGVPSREGAMEKFSSLLFLFSAMILIISTTRINRRLCSSVARRRIIFLLIAISGIFLIIFGEEISWGQRVFAWDSAGIFEEYNFQDETNVHNFFNPLFKYIYPIVGMSSFIVLFFIWFFHKEKKTYLFNLIFPHPGLFFLVYVMACSSFYGPSEIYEQLLAIFVLLYSIRIFMCLIFPKIDSGPV
ncbi:MAG: hypothetical protein HQ542_13880 [Bacteroidia bacterium]|nr:hypothetical protein [Bacteroidia bacterium]